MALDVAASPPPPAAVPARAPLARRTPAGLEPNATLVDRDDLTPTIVRLRIRVDGGTSTFRAGQYFAIGLAVDGRFVQRPYSAASAPAGAGDLEFLIRLVPGGSLTPSLWRLAPGDRVRVGPPKGLFTLDQEDPRRHLLLSTGTGLAPLRSMLASLLASPPGSAPSGPPIVVHGVASAPELAYRSELERLAGAGSIVYVPTISRPDHPSNAGWTGWTGRLDGLIGAVADIAGVDPAATVVYLCGNPAMIAAVEPRLAAIGIPADAIRAEQYWTTLR